MPPDGESFKTSSSLLMAFSCSPFANNPDDPRFTDAMELGLDVIDCRLISCGACAERYRSRLADADYGQLLPDSLLCGFLESLDATGYGYGEPEFGRQCSRTWREAAAYDMTGSSWTPGERLEFQKLVVQHAYRVRQHGGEVDEDGRLVNIDWDALNSHLSIIQLKNLWARYAKPTSWDGTWATFVNWRATM